MLAEEPLQSRPHIFFIIDLDQADARLVGKRLLIGLAQRREVRRLAPDIVRDLAVTDQVADLDHLAHQRFIAADPFRGGFPFSAFPLLEAHQTATAVVRA